MRNERKEEEYTSLGVRLAWSWGRAATTSTIEGITGNMLAPSIEARRCRNVNVSTQGEGELVIALKNSNAATPTARGCTTHRCGQRGGAGADPQ